MILDQHRPPLQTRGSYLVLLNNASGAEYLCHVLAALPKENEGDRGSLEGWLSWFCFYISTMVSYAGDSLMHLGIPVYIPRYVAPEQEFTLHDLGWVLL